MRKHLAMVATIAGASTVLLACGNPRSGPTIPAVQSPWEQWVIFNEPMERMILGAAWDGSGVADTGCYAYASDSTIGGRAWSSYNVAWSDSTSGSVGLAVAKAFGFGASIERAASGYIHFDSLKTRQAINLGPTGRCIASARGLPRYPAVYALLGADSLSFELKSSSGTSLDARADFKQADSGAVKFRTSKNRGTAAQFGTTRWVAGRFIGVVALDSARDTTWTGYFPFNQYHQLHWGFEAKVVPTGDNTGSRGRFRVIVHKEIPPVWDTLIVDEGQTFAFGVPRNQIVRGEFYLGRVFSNAQASAVQIWGERQSFREVHFDRNELRDSLSRWSRRP